jgi:hypothetical protein
MLLMSGIQHVMAVNGKPGTRRNLLRIDEIAVAAHIQRSVDVQRDLR